MDRRRLQILRQAWQHRTRRPGALTATAMAALLAAGGAAYTVSGGDTLGHIAQRLGTTVGALAEANSLDDPDVIYVGQVLTIPGEGVTPSAPAAAAADSDAGGTHVVASGESLSTIAQRYGLTVEQLARANGITDPSRLMAGSLLRVATEAPPAPGTPTGGSAGGTHTIAPGESLSGIAAAYGTTVAALVEANGMTDPNRIIAGTTIVVPGGSGGGAGWQCPVPGASYVNDYGVAKPDGRFHEGIDMFAPGGTIIHAPVGGTVRHVEGPRAGLQFVLEGDDGYTYIGTHLESFGEAGRVEIGAPLGQVGTTGNARGTSPHLHLEMHHSGAVNPYPTLQAYC